MKSVQPSRVVGSVGWRRKCMVRYIIVFGFYVLFLHFSFEHYTLIIHNFLLGLFCVYTEHTSFV